MLIENRDECRQRVIEHSVDRTPLSVRQLCSRCAFDLYVGDLDGSDDIADPDRCRGLGESDTAARASDGGEKASVGEDVNDLEDILLGYAEPFGNVGDLHKLVCGQSAIDKDADGVAGLLRQAHRVFTRAARPQRNISPLCLFHNSPRGGKGRARGLARTSADRLLTAPWIFIVYRSSR